MCLSTTSCKPQVTRCCQLHASQFRRGECCRREQEEAEAAVQRRKDDIAQRRAHKAASSPAEPPAGAPASLIRVRLPNGATAQRRFEPGAPVAAVYDWVDSLEEFEAWEYALTTMHPRRELERGSESVEDAGLMPNAALLAIARDD